MVYPIKNYTEIGFGWQLADCNGFLYIKWFAGEQDL